jgi:hypothetical protein
MLEVMMITKNGKEKIKKSWEDINNLAGIVVN